MFDDEFAGQGGSYLQDPITGKRTRIEEPTQDISVATFEAAPEIVEAEREKSVSTDQSIEGA